jgi:mono/diheme cytochrome c family protein
MAAAAATAACLTFPAGATGTATSDLVSRGGYLASAGDCVACHTAPDGKPLAGGLMMNTPFGAISTPNITPDKATGIGSWTDDQFYRVMHEGIGHRGEYLYPVMPFPWYTNVTRDDVMAIRAWLATQPAVSKPRTPNKLSFPFSVRESLLAWRTAFFKTGEFKPDPNQSDEVNRGAYLVNGLTHCGECHNARKVVGASKWEGALKGGVIDSWYAPNITSDVRDGIGAWSNSDIATYLKTGVSPDKGIALGPMAETVHSLSKLNDADLLAIAAYLKTTPATANGEDQKHALFSGPNARGGETYLNHCASCHGVDGKGLAGIIPALDGNGAVTAKGPQNIINVVLGGLEARDRYAPMPAVGSAMSDLEVADVTNYVRQNWGNAALATAQPDMVAALRKSTSTLMNVSPNQACPSIGDPAVASAFDSNRNGLRTQIGALTDANMPERVGPLLARVRTAAGGASQADLINGMSAAYCKALRADTTLDWNQKSVRLGNFSQLVYMAASGHPVGTSSGALTGSRRTAQK